MKAVVDTNVVAYYLLETEPFVELADREDLSLATFDKEVIKAFPSLAMHPGKLTKS